MREASLWFARMRGPEAEDHRAQFEHWLTLGASHRDAYERAGEIFALGRFLASERGGEKGLANDNEPPLRRWRWSAIAAGLVLMLGVGGAWFANTRGHPGASEAQQIARTQSREPGEQTRYIAPEGVRRSVRLRDGSSVELEGGSELAVHFGAAKRDLELLKGRARFEVAHEARPFTVHAGGGSVTARGTVFDVVLGGDERVTVHLLRGVVDVERPDVSARGQAMAAVARLEPGEVFSFAALPSGGRAIPLGVEPLGETGPGSGKPLIREFERTPLSAIIAEANRGSKTAIRIADPAIGALRVSGRFRVDDPEQVADRLATLFDLAIDRTSTGEITLRKH
ncbi:FecR family protein [Novosphingobium profundi]|uniref:FecR family protein n=1 Tax=Novosphingobium profundi TaxID=1774954 RepID=UPI001FE4299A|nr:FecR domain-containing protein [Novosphingobium profundi]